MSKFITYVSLFFLIISSFSDRISPLTFSYISYFGLFFPFIFVFNILFLFFWLISKKWKQVFVILIVFIICREAIYTYFPIHNTTKNIPKGCIHILTYNVMHFGYCGKHTKEKPDLILQYVVDQNPDIICFQEFKLGNKLTLSTIRKILSATPHYFFLPCGVALFSKYPILSAKKIPFESLYNGALIAELDMNGKKVTIVNCHLESNKISDNEKIDYYNLIKSPCIQKLEAFLHVVFRRLTPAFKIRALQSAIIAETIRESKNPYVMICGDFNDTPISYTYREIKGNLKDAFVENGCGMGISFNANCFMFRIDYIFHSKNMQAYHTMVGKMKKSDHYPVQTYLQFTDY